MLSPHPLRGLERMLQSCLPHNDFTEDETYTSKEFVNVKEF